MTLWGPSFSLGFPAMRPPARFALLALGLSLPVAVTGPGPAALFLAMSVPVVLGARRYPHPRIGVCNAMTMARLAFVAVLAGSVGTAPGWFELGIALAALATDGVDGWAARRAGLISRFGARFDMEVDSVFGLVLAVLAMERLGPWVLALGLFRYLWLAAGVVIPRLTGSLPDSFARKAVCVLQIGALIAVLCPALPQGAAIGVAVVAGAALVWSFGRDAIWRLRHG